MKVICASVDDFLSNLSLAGDGNVFNSAVWIDVSSAPTDKDGKGTRTRVVIQAAAVVIMSDEREYLLVLGQFCGNDYHDSSQEFKGSLAAEESRKRIVLFCDSAGLTVRPGMVEE